MQAGFEPWVNGTGLAVNNFSYSIGGTPPPPPPSSAPPSVPPSSAPPSSPPAGGGACRVTYTPQQWQGGFTANVTVANTGGSAINGWTLTFAFPSSQQITSAWNATVTQSGSSVTAKSLSYNGNLAPGASTSFGFQGTWSSSNPSPTAFNLNGTGCGTG